MQGNSMKKNASGTTVAERDNDILDIQRKFRVMDRDGKAHGDEAQSQIRKQRAAIEKLTRENRKIKGDVNNARATFSANQNAQLGDRMTRLKEDLNETDRMVRIERENKKELEAKLSTLEERLGKCREKLGSMGGVNAAKETDESVAKQIRVLENRLDKALQKFNEAVARNKELRDQIDSLRRERVVFDNIYRKLERDLDDKKKQMADIIETANNAYAARDTAQTQMAALKAQADKEHAEFEREWRELGRLIESDRRIKEAMKQREKAREEEEKRGEFSMEEEARLKKKGTKTGWNVLKDKGQIRASLEKIAAYEESFAKIQAATGISDIDELVSTFISAEDQNFSLFSYANELSAEIESLEAQIAELKVEIERYKSQGPSSDPTKQKAMAELEERWASLDKKAERYEQRYQTAMKTVRALMTGVQSIFTRLECNTPEVQEMLGGQGIAESNLMSYLGIIEQRTNEILNLYRAMQEERDLPAEGGAQIPPKRPQPVALSYDVKIPSTVEDHSEEDASDEEDDAKPLTREELRLRTMKGLSKKSEQRGKRRAK
uniref:ODAD1 central coiled coil region domain-containing protein n=1 Tax=Chromera velia CCMP2878 TaxID=1169474 RepID=A0A0G4G626_9ALVE|eukprot:Cvel_4193.t1-p1 / transcript=Cvel_4193.t1 / gene=Cvel_4193 / organism=Chromera_velia_CCMP2878 / gene_product=Outer dynein arm protein 1, putative / transcript_product=Outer dynein arm protein 1, putative / location=Cvel_scaffold181:5843-7495(+) / protein_length=551 / sequence_SO=supercontig / SO=protein_coding / is_pseudo=false